ncbi:MAG TPA: SurA N-terminal domain-containing protein [Thermoanaerobaculia bacterium]|jgi:hypothetical protein|nr:SurA N-terminal domain-containing protein [Thermoanaerobaculia bacterium]
MASLLDRALFGILLAALPAAGLAAQGAQGAAEAASGAPVAKLLDRVVAVVDEDPILASDIDRVIGLGLVAAKAGENTDLLRRRVLDQLIEQRLRSHEIDRSGFIEVPVEEIERQIGEIRARFPDEAAFERRLVELGMTRATLAQLVARQIAVLVYIEERLGPRVFVSLDDIRDYYASTLTSEVEKRGEKVPPLDDVREQIRAVLREQRLNVELARWSEELRRNSDVESFYDEPVNRLPSLLRTIEKPPR